MKRFLWCIVLLGMARKAGVHLRLQTDYHSVTHSGGDWVNEIWVHSL